jgi:hypothetical protein
LEELMSIRKYMFIDLAILSIIGTVLEGIGTWACFYAFTGSVPTTVFSLLILFIAITRWKWWGLVIIPILVSGNFIGVLSIETSIFNDYKNIFDINYILSNALGMVSCFWIIILHNKIGVKKIVKNNFILAVILITMFIIYETIRISLYWFIGGRGYIVISANFIDIISLIMLILGSLIIKNQGILVDVEKQLIEDENYLIKEKSISFNVTDEEIDILKEVKNIQ